MKTHCENVHGQSIDTTLSTVNLDDIDTTECIVCKNFSNYVIKCSTCGLNGAVCSDCDIKLQQYGYKKNKCITCNTQKNNDIENNNNDNDIENNNDTENNLQSDRANRTTTKCQTITKYIIGILFAGWMLSYPGYLLYACIFDLKYTYNFNKSGYGFISGIIVAVILLGFYKCINKLISRN